MPQLLFFIGLGGALGSVLRFLIGTFVTKTWGGSFQPLGTLTVNIIGCLIIGVVGALIEKQILSSEHLRVFIISGLLGGFTTFSAFGLETTLLLRKEDFAAALINVGLSVFLGLAAVALGFKIVAILKP